MFCLQSKYLDNKVNCRVQTIYRKFRHFKVEEFVGKKYLQTFSMSFPALYYVCIYGVAVLLYKACCMWCTMEPKSFYAMLAL